MKKLFRLLFTGMDLFRFAVMLLVVGNLALGGILIAQWSQKRDLLGQIERDQSTIGQMMLRHGRLRDMFSYLQTDKLAGEARGDLEEYVSNATRAAMIPSPDGGSRSTENPPRNVAGTRVKESMLDVTWKTDTVSSRPATDGPWSDSIRGGFTQKEILTLLYYLEKNSERVKVNQMSLKPYKPNPSGGRSTTLQSEEPNEFWRWNISKLSVLMRTLEGSASG